MFQNIKNFISNLWKGASATTQLGESPQVPDNSLLDRHQVLVENLAAALVIRDQLGAITYCSPFTEVLSGFSLSEIYGAEGDFFLSRVHPADQDSFRRALELARLGESYQMRHRFFHQSGFEIWIESRTTPLLDHESGFVASLTLMFDVTRAVRFEEQLREKNGDLEQITAVAAEEIQNEVFTLQGMMTLFQESISSDELKRSVLLSAEKLNNLSRGLLDFGKASQGSRELQTFSLSQIVKRFQSEYASDRCLLALKELDEEDFVLGEIESLLEVLEALLTYSLDLRPDKDTPLSVQLSLQKVGSEVQLYFEDSNPPLPRTLTRILTDNDTFPFGLLPTLQKGAQTPFSIALARKKLSSMGGKLSFQHTPKNSNCFVLSLRGRTPLAGVA